MDRMTFLFAAVLVAVVTALPVNLPARESKASSGLHEAELVLQQLFKSLRKIDSEKSVQILGDSLAETLSAALLLPGAMMYPFDSLNLLGKVRSADGKLRVFTYQLPGGTEAQLYEGFVLLLTEPDSPAKVFRLRDISESLEDPENTSLDKGDWYGCLVYEIVEMDNYPKSCYVLLGYDPHGMFISRRIVDILCPEKNGTVFGAPVFQMGNKLQHRVIFEYSARARMTLRWSPKAKMLIFDHLSPAKTSQSGNRQYYGPDFSYDALKPEKGKWVLTEDVDVRLGM